jgi:hypothetical protein
MTPEDWTARLEELVAGAELTVETNEGKLLVARGGHHIPASCDYLTRWCMHRVGLEPYGINTPDWSCSWRSNRGGEGLRFLQWQIGVDFVAIFVDEAEDKRGGYDRIYTILDMPIPEENPRPEGWGDLTRDERRAQMREDRPRKQLLMLLALVHFVEWLIANDIHGPA